MDFTRAPGLDSVDDIYIEESDEYRISRGEPGSYRCTYMVVIRVN